MRKVSRVIAVIAVTAGLVAAGGFTQSASAAKCNSKIDRKCTYKQLRGQVMETVRNTGVTLDR